MFVYLGEDAVCRICMNDPPPAADFEGTSGRALLTPPQFGRQVERGKQEVFPGMQRRFDCGRRPGGRRRFDDFLLRFHLVDLAI